MTRQKICEVNPAVRDQLAPGVRDKSGIGVHYVDAFIKPLNTTLPDGSRIICKRKGLKVTLTIGDRKGEGIMRRLDVSKDPVVMLEAALREAARAAGVELSFDGNEIVLARP